VWKEGEYIMKVFYYSASWQGYDGSLVNHDGYVLADNEEIAYGKVMEAYGIKRSCVYVEETQVIELH